jgi:tRNA nucleotidyltransferase (CCA-adding enzyme)
MPDYVYLLERRLSPAQRSALSLIRDAARTEGMTSFLTGGAVRDLTSGHPVRDFDVTVQGDALKLRERLESAGFVFWGSHAPSQTLFLRYPGGVRLEISSARKETFAEPAHPTYEWASILEDLRRRDFTVNAMAISLNEGSYGLLMDPTNGVADIEMRTLRLVSNYGFLEDPIRLLRAVRLGTRLGWLMDERTKQRFDNAMEEGVFSAISSYQRGYELEEIGHEESPLEMLRTLEQQGWMKHLYPAWTVSKADAQGLGQLHELQTRLQMEGIYPDISAAAMELLTARMPPKDIAGLKKLFVRPGFVKEWERLDKEAEAFAAKLTAKESNVPSATWKLLTRSAAEPVLWLGLTGKGAAIQNKYKNFFTVWPEARQKVPTALMLEMRITPELERYPELLQELFFQTMDNKLNDEAALRAFLEPYSPPAPPPPVNLRKPRAAKKKSAKKEESTQSAAAAPHAAGAEAAVKGKATSPAKAAAVAVPQKPAPAKAASAKTAPAKAVPAKAAPAKVAAPAKAPAKAIKAEAKPKAAATPPKKTAAKKAPEKKPAAKPAPKKAPAKKPAVKAKPAKTAEKAAKKTAPAKKPAAKRAATKKAPAKKAAVKKKR